MPSTRIETRTGWITAPDEVIAAVHAALVEALKIPEDDRTLRLVEHAPGHFPPPPGRGERFIASFVRRNAATMHHSSALRAQ